MYLKKKSKFWEPLPPYSPGRSAAPEDIVIVLKTNDDTNDEKLHHKSVQFKDGTDFVTTNNFRTIYY